MKSKRSLETSGVDVPLTFPTHDEIERHIARSRQLRAEATTAMLTSAGRWLARPLHRLKALMSRWHRRTTLRLTRYSARLLADATARARTAR